MAISVGSTTSDAVGAAGTSRSFSHDATGADLLLVRVHLRGSTVDPANPAATYAGVSMSLVTAASAINGTSHEGVWIFLLAHPATGSNTVAVSWTNTSTPTLAATNFSGTISASGGTATTGSTGTASRTVTSNVGDMVVDALSVGNLTVTPDASQTQDYNVINAALSRGAGSHKAGAAGSTAMSMTISGLPNWAYAACALNPVSEGGFFEFFWK